jgi:putative transposase
MGQYQTFQINIKKGHKMCHYFQTMCENSKNLYNVTNFYIRQIYTGLNTDKSLHPLQQEVLEIFKKSIEKMNNIQTQAYLKRLEIEKRKRLEEQKELKCNLFELPTKEKPHVDYHFLDALFKIIAQYDYRSLPTQSSQWMMKQCFQDWNSFYAQLKDYKIHPEKYKARPNIPNYSKSKQKEVLFTNQDCVIKDNKYLKFPKTKFQLNIGKLGFGIGKLKQVRVLPKYNGYTVELVMDAKENIEMRKDNGRYLSIDLGVNNLATIVTNTGMKPVIINGRPIKSINAYYNKLKAHYLSILRHGQQPKQGMFTSKKLENIHQKRFFKIKDYFHKASFHLVKIAMEENISKIFIGKNQDWKQDINIGKVNNQNFATIPHSLLIQMITYKANRLGIVVEVVEESYTSKASFLDLDHIPTYQKVSNQDHIFSGKRIRRGLYQSKEGSLFNADVNGACNILRKAVPNSFQQLDGIKGLFVSTPQVLSVR